MFFILELAPTIMKSKLSCLLFTFMYLSSYSQDVDVTNVFKITVINPGLSWENRIGKLQTIYVQAFINTTAFYGNNFNAGGRVLELSFDPAATLHYRYYFNGHLRKNNGKRIEANSMNYRFYQRACFLESANYQGLLCGRQ